MEGLKPPSSPPCDATGPSYINNIAFLTYWDWNKIECFSNVLHLLKNYIHGIHTAEIGKVMALPLSTRGFKNTLFHVTVLYHFAFVICIWNGKHFIWIRSIASKKFRNRRRFWNCASSNIGMYPFASFCLLLLRIMSITLSNVFFWIWVSSKSAMLMRDVLASQSMCIWR